jgi:hypothetical protein
VDTSLGRLHNKTFTSSDILDAVASLGMRNVQVRRHRDTDSDPMEQEKLDKLERVIGVVSERAAAVPDSDDLIARGCELARRLSEVGAQGEPVLFLTCEK